MRILFAIIATYLLAIKGILQLDPLVDYCSSLVCWRFYLVQILKAFNQASSLMPSTDHLKLVPYPVVRVKI